MPHQHLVVFKQARGTMRVLVTCTGWDNIKSAIVDMLHDMTHVRDAAVEGPDVDRSKIQCFFGDVKDETVVYYKHDEWQNILFTLPGKSDKNVLGDNMGDLIMAFVEGGNGIADDIDVYDEAIARKR